MRYGKSMNIFSKIIILNYFTTIIAASCNKKVQKWNV